MQSLQRQVSVYVSFEDFAPRRLLLSATFPSPGTGKDLQAKVGLSGRVCRSQGMRDALVAIVSLTLDCVCRQE